MSIGARREVRIQTPEGVSFALPLAGVLSRMLAVIVDLAVVGVITSTLEKVLGVVGVLSPQLSAALRDYRRVCGGVGLSDRLGMVLAGGKRWGSDCWGCG